MFFVSKMYLLILVSPFKFVFDGFTLTQFVIWFDWLVDSSIVGGLFMSKKKIYDQKHLSTSQRIHIEKGLNDGLSFAASDK